MKLDPKHQVVFDAVKAALPNVTVHELDYGFTVVLHNPETDIAAHLAIALRGSWSNAETLVAYLSGETVPPDASAFMYVRRHTPEEVTAIIGDAIQRKLDERAN